MAAPSGRRNGGGGGASLWAALLLAAWALRPAEAVSEPTTVAFDVQPGGAVHSFSQNVGPGVSAVVERGAQAPGEGVRPEAGARTSGTGPEEGCTSGLATLRGPGH